MDHVYCRLSVSITPTVLMSKRTQSTDPLDVGLEQPHTTMHMTLRASSASYGRHCKIGAATKIAPVKCTIPESVLLKSLH